MSTGGDTAAEIRQRLHRITPWDEGPSIGTKVVQEGLRQLSLPGQYARGVLAGKPGEKATSEEVMGRLGVTRPGPVGKFAWDVATDPLTYAGPGLARLAAEGPGPLLGAIKRFGAEEAGAVKLPQFFHGSSTPGITRATLDPLRAAPRSDYGRGVYLTSSPEEAVRYATAGRGAGRTPTVYRAGVNPGDVLELMRRSPARFNDLAAASMGGHPGALNELDRLAGGEALDVLKATQRHLLGALGDEEGSRELIRRLRGGGYDALLAQEGGGIVPHRTMVVLDPRDTVSRVGRPGGVASWRSDPTILKRVGVPSPEPPAADPFGAIEGF